jgi:hypothetical protein
MKTYPIQPAWRNWLEPTKERIFCPIPGRMPEDASPSILNTEDKERWSALSGGMKETPELEDCLRAIMKSLSLHEQEILNVAEREGRLYRSKARLRAEMKRKREWCAHLDDVPYLFELFVNAPELLATALLDDLQRNMLVWDLPQETEREVISRQARGEIRTIRGAADHQERTFFVTRNKRVFRLWETIQFKEVLSFYHGLLTAIVDGFRDAKGLLVDSSPTRKATREIVLRTYRSQLDNLETLVWRMGERRMALLGKLREQATIHMEGEKATLFVQPEGVDVTQVQLGELYVDGFTLWIELK